MTYTNSQLRSILNGLGYRSQIETDDSNFPLSNDNSPLSDEATIQAIKKFQLDYQLQVSGVADFNTRTKIQAEMNALHAELNQAVNANISSDEPFYGPETITAVQHFQQQNSPDGIASFPLREELYIATNATTVKQNQAQVTSAKA